MSRTLLMLTLTVLALLCSTAYGDELLIVNGSAETLGRINLETNEVNANIAQLGIWPNEILISGDSAFIINSGPDEISVYDLADSSMVNTISIGPGFTKNPYNMAEITPDTFLVTNWLSGSVTKFTASGEVVGEYPIDGDNPQGILSIGDTSFITTVSFVWNDTSYDNGFVAAWDNIGDSTLFPLKVGDNPNDLSLGPDGNLYVACAGKYGEDYGSIYIVDPSLMQVVDSIIIGGDPTDIDILPNGIGFIAAGGDWFSGGQGFVMTIDINTRAVLHGENDPLVTDAGVMSVMVASDSTVFSFNWADDTITELDSAGNVLRRFLAGDGCQAGAIWRTSDVCEYPRGDANASGGVDIDDVVYLIGYIFDSGPEPVCDKVSGDVNCSGGVDIDDVVYLIGYIFSEGPAPCDY